MPKTIRIPARELQEELYLYTHSPHEGLVAVELVYGTFDASGRFIPDRSVPYQCHRITGQDYSDLLAQDGAGLAPGKPAGTFRREDLGPFVERVRAAKEKKR